MLLQSWGSSKSESRWEVTGFPLPCLSQSKLGLHENKRPHRKRFLCSRFRLSVPEVMWFIMLFLCKCLSPDTSGICGYSEPRRSQKEAAMMRLVLLRSAGSSHAPQYSRQVPSGRRPCSQISPLLGPVLPLPARMEWSEDNTRAFLWEVSPEGTKAVGRGKLRLSDQQALGYIQCFLCLLPRVFFVVCFQAPTAFSKKQI